MSVSLSARFEAPEITLSRSYAAFESPDDFRDMVYEDIARGDIHTYTCEVPDEFDLREYAQPVRDQGTRGSCAAFTASAIKEVGEKLDSGSFSEWMSPEFIYYHRGNKPANGMYGRDVFQILKRIGTVPESMYPYHAAGGAPPPSKKLYQVAAQYRIASFARVTTVDGLKRALVEFGPCYLLLPLFKTRPHFWRPTSDEGSASNHAVAVFGYTRAGFILRNSWGQSWNNGGYVEFPFSDWSMQKECWVIIDEKCANDVDSGTASVRSSVSLHKGSMHASPPRARKSKKKEKKHCVIS